MHRIDPAKEAAAPQSGGEATTCGGFGGNPFSPFGDPGSGVVRYGNVASNWLSSTSAPSVYGRLALAGLPGPGGSSVPIATRSSMSTTSSPGRRPFGKPAGSQPGLPSVSAPSTKQSSAPRLFWLPFGVAGSAVLRRSISERHDVVRLVDAGNAGQERGDEIDARKHRRRLHAGRAEQDLEQRRQRRVGHVGRELAVVLRLARVEAVLVLEADDDLVDERHAEARDLLRRRRLSIGSCPCRRPASTVDAVVQTPITGSLPCVTHAIGTSIASEVTFLSADALDDPERLPITRSTGMLTRSKISPRLTAKPSLRWPTKTRPGVAQPGMLTL